MSEFKPRHCDTCDQERRAARAYIIGKIRAAACDTPYEDIATAYIVLADVLEEDTTNE